MTLPRSGPAGVSATLVLVRHGESVWIAEGRFQGRLDPPLSELGQRQAELVARRLADREPAPLPIPDGPPAGIWHSPLTRAAATAREIAARQPAPPPLHPTAELIEIGQGEWEGLLHAEVSARWPAELAAWRRTPTLAHAPGGEPLLAAAERVRRGLDAMTREMADVRPTDPPPADAPPADAAPAVAQPRGSPVPGYPTRPTDGRNEPWAIVVAHDGIFRLAVMTLLDLPYERFWSLPFSLCAISVVSLSEGVAALRAHNLADHLAPLAAAGRAAAEARGDRRGAL